MAKLYANRIIREKDDGEERFTIDNVPNYWKQSTLDILDSEGYDGYGLPL